MNPCVVDHDTFYANFAGSHGKDNIHDKLGECGLDYMKRDVTRDIESLLTHLGIDWKNDPSMKDTPERVARMYIEVMRGRLTPEPKVTDFPNTMKLDQMYCVGPVDIRSMCSHHLVPVMGKAWFGIILDQKSNILGLSKFGRIADWIFARPHMQEEATAMLADKLEEICKPRGLALIVRASHGCTTWRGLKAEGSQMITSEMRGAFRDNPASREEFMAHIKGLGY